MKLHPIMKLSERGYVFLKNYEKCRLAAYQDSAGVWTIGWGHTRNVTSQTRWNQQQAEDALVSDVAWAEAQVNKDITAIMKQCQFDALVILCYNIGGTAFHDSTLRLRLNAGSVQVALKIEWPRWNKASVNGRLTVVDGLTRRRADEIRLFESNY